MKKNTFRKLRGIQTLGSWEFMWQAAVFLYIWVAAFAFVIGLFIYIFVSLWIHRNPFSAWEAYSDLQASFIFGLSLSMLLFSVFFTLILLELYDRIIYKPVKSLLEEVEKISGYRGLSSKVEFYLRGGKGSPLDLYNPQESWIDRVKEYMQTASNDRYFDDLTGCFNKKYLTGVLTEILKTQMMVAIPNRKMPRTVDSICYAFYLIDIDYFKAINDEFGHIYGDQVLAQVGRTLRECVGSEGAVIRYGGEEFLLVVAHNYPMDYTKYAEAIRSAFCESVFVTSAKTKEVRAVTCSIGYTPFPLFDEYNTSITVQEHVDLSDQAMYMSKNGGRNTWRGIKPIKAPSNPLKLERLKVSLEFGIENNFVGIVKPDDITAQKAAMRPGSYFTRRT